ncbi:hypothetical protein HWV62_23813 [Athelia sp. TMB]|nr:hypothetical protein HWV62_23813 [Athelia sp. TMB]
MAEEGSIIGSICGMWPQSISWEKNLDANQMSYCDTKAYGGGGGTRQAGCCNKCFDDSFNADPFDGPVPKSGQQTTQPSGTTEMTVPKAADESPAPPYTEASAPVPSIETAPAAVAESGPAPTPALDTTTETVT